jgi:hypothetical protein
MLRPGPLRNDEDPGAEHDVFQTACCYRKLHQVELVLQSQSDPG